MKSCLVALLLFVSTIMHTSAAIYTFTWDSGFANGGIIPDNNANGWQDSRVISGFAEGTLMYDVNVHLTISGGYNGDLYGYLVHSSGFVVLLNRIGSTSGNPAGYNNPGMNIVFDQGAATDIHLHGVLSGILTGAWQPDGRSADPSTVLNTSPRDTSLNSFNYLDPNGTWTLYLQDHAFGDLSQVTSWGIEMNAVLPEPVSVSLGLFGGLIAVQCAVRKRQNGS